MNRSFSQKEIENIVRTVLGEYNEPKKSVVQVYFPSRGMGWAYYNDRFDLKVGDLVYVEGKLEGQKGRVTEVNYSFKIKPSDYKKVIAVIDTNVKGEVYLAGSHVVSFDKNAIPFEKVKPWFKAPDSEEYVIGCDDEGLRFPLDDLKQMDISQVIAERGHEYYMEGRVGYVSVDGNHGWAIVKGNETYEVEFDYIDGEISNLTCTCFCAYTCKHEFATMLQLKETLELISKNYQENYNGYLAAIDKDVFMTVVLSKKETGKIILEG